MMPKEIFWSGLKGGLFEKKHYKAMGESIWFFGWLCVRQSQINESGEGLPHYGNPLTDEKISEDTGFSIRTIQSWRARLVRTGYIHTARVGNAGLVYFIHKAKHKAKNPKPSTRYFPAELQPNGNYKVSHDSAGPGPKVPQDSAGTYAGICDTYTDKPQENQRDARNADTLTPKHLSNYKTHAAAKTAADVSSLLKEAGRELQPPPQKQPRSLQEQKEELRRRGFLSKEQPGQVIAIQKEATA